jgi:hypothetical protein
MSDDAPKPAEDAELKKREEAVDSAWDALYEAVKEYGRARGNLAFYQGWAAGREHTREVFMKAMEEYAAQQKTRQSNAVVTPSTPLVEAPPPVQQVHAAPIPRWNEIVLEAIKANPGMRGVNLLTKIREVYPTLHERSFRTSLHRLKAAGEIFSDSRQWFDKSHSTLSRLAKGSTGPKDEGGQQ